MLDILGIATLTAVLLLGAILTLYNSRQAAALQEMETVLSDWYLMQIAERRDQRRKQILVGNPLSWVHQQTGISVTGIERSLKDPLAVECLTEQADHRLVISPLSPRQLRNAIRPLEVRKNKNGVANLVDPLLGRRFEVMDRSIASSEWFDLEADQVGKALGVDWGEPRRLWFYWVKK